MKNVCNVIFVIIATLIGAGFASGQEMYVFFYKYGLRGILGVAVCSAFMGYIIYKTFKLLHIHDIENYKDFIDLITKTMPSKVKKLGISSTLNTIINIFLLLTFFIMIAGFGAYFEQEFGVNNYIGSILLAIIVYLTLSANVKGVMKVNSILIPVLIIFIIIIGIINFAESNLNSKMQILKNLNSSGWLLSSILYTSYNSILLIPVLVTLNRYLKNMKQVKIISVIIGFIMTILAVVIIFLLTKTDIDLGSLEMPVVYVIGEFFSQFKFIYAFIILASIYTTAISIGMSFLSNVTKTKNTYMKILLFVCVLAVLVSGVGFSNLINMLYPFFGYLGLIQILLLILKK